VYLDKLVQGLSLQGIQAPLLLMLSDGGLTARDDVMRAPIKAIESGPAAGVIAATAFGAEVGEPELLAFDMGGTTAKLCLVSGGKPGKSGLFEAARARRFIKGSGLPIRTPAIELIEIGAGGGSIAAADHLGLLKVGPESAGSSPGPACFALGGTQPTVTDANFVLGYLDARTFAGGSLPIEPELGKAAIQRLARELDMTLERTAWGIVDVVNETMARAASVHIAEHGRDPRQFVLAATGGGGPLHAYQVARKLGVRRILCPAGAGVASAIGLLRAPASVTSMKTRIEPFESIDWADLEQVYLQLEDESRTLLQGTGVDTRTAVTRRHAELRYAGQSSETSVELEPGPYTAGKSRESALAAFERAYRARYAKAPRSTNIELTAVKVEVAAEVPQWSNDAAMDDATFTGIGAASRPVYFPELSGYAETRIYHRGDLASGQRYRGPAIVEDRTSTIVVGPRASFGVAAAVHLLIELDDEGQEGSA
jgi:N-methylhydantoinase A